MDGSRNGSPPRCTRLLRPLRGLNRAIFLSFPTFQHQLDNMSKLEDEPYLMSRVATENSFVPSTLTPSFTPHTLRLGHLFECPPHLHRVSCCEYQGRASPFDLFSCSTYGTAHRPQILNSCLLWPTSRDPRAHPISSRTLHNQTTWSPLTGSKTQTPVVLSSAIDLPAIRITRRAAVQEAVETYSSTNSNHSFH